MARVRKGRERRWFPLPRAQIPAPFLSNGCHAGSKPGGGYSHTLPIRVCAAQRGRDFEAPDLERGIHFTGVS